MPVSTAIDTANAHHNTPQPIPVNYQDAEITPPAGSNATIFLCNFLSKGWEVSVLGVLLFFPVYELPTYIVVGLLSTVFIVCQITISLFAGKIAHAMTNRRVICLAIASSAICWLIVALSDNIASLVVAYMFGGIASGLFEPIGNSLVAKSSTSKKRGGKIGNFAACGDMGKIAVFFLATSVAAKFGLQIACLLLFCTAFVSYFLAIVFLPKAVATAHNEPKDTPVHLRELVKNRNFCLATAAGIADSFSSASLYIFIPFLLAAKGIAVDDTPSFNAIFFAGYMSGRLVLGRLADKFGGPLTLIVSELSMAVLIVVVTLVSGNSLFVIFVLLFILGIFTRGTSPIIRAMVADSMHDGACFHNAFSTYSFASRSSSAVCRPIYGLLANYSGIAAVFYVASAVSLLALYPAAKYNTNS